MDSSDFSIVLYKIFSSGHSTVLIWHGSKFQEIDCRNSGEWNIIEFSNKSSTESQNGNFTNVMENISALLTILFVVLEHTELTSIEVVLMLVV